MMPPLPMMPQPMMGMPMMAPVGGVPYPPMPQGYMGMGMPSMMPSMPSAQYDVDMSAMVPADQKSGMPVLHNNICI